MYVSNASYSLSVSRFIKSKNNKVNCLFHYSMLVDLLELLIFYWRRPLDTEWEGEDHVKCINVLSFKKSFFNRMRFPLRHNVGMLIRGIEKNGPSVSGWTHLAGERLRWGCDGLVAFIGFSLIKIHSRLYSIARTLESRNNAGKMGNLLPAAWQNDYLLSSNVSYISRCRSGCWPLVCYS